MSPLQLLICQYKPNSIAQLGAENASKIISKLIEFAELQNISVSSDEKSLLDQLQLNLKDKERITTLVFPKIDELIALLTRFVQALPVER